MPSLRKFSRRLLTNLVGSALVTRTLLSLCEAAGMDCPIIWEELNCPHKRQSLHLERSSTWRGTAPSSSKQEAGMGLSEANASENRKAPSQPFQVLLFLQGSDPVLAMTLAPASPVQQQLQLNISHSS